MSPALKSTRTCTCARPCARFATACSTASTDPCTSPLTSTVSTGAPGPSGASAASPSTTLPSGAAAAALAGTEDADAAAAVAPGPSPRAADRSVSSCALAASWKVALRVAESRRLPEALSSRMRFWRARRLVVVGWGWCRLVG
jgi:hypothetical protein